MISVLQQFVAPAILAGLMLWAAWLAFAGESEGDLPRALAGQLADDGGRIGVARTLHIAHLTLLALAGVVAGAASAWWVWPALAGLGRILVAVALVWALGDLLPRLLASVAPDLIAPARRGALRTLALLKPLIRLVAWIDARMEAPPPPPERRDGGVTQRDMLLGVFSLGDMTVAEVMTPRIDVVAVDLASTREEVMEVLQSSEHARLPVYDTDPDAVAGVVYAKDMLASVADAGVREPWQALIRPAAFVPEGKTLDRQLRDFQRGPAHLAVVVDEFGGTAGLVTLEDILEQIVGEIQDEHDTDEVAPLQRLEDGRLRVQGGVPLAELEAELGHDFGREDVSTVGGLVLAELGRVPRAGEHLRLGEFELTVEQVARRRVRRVVVARGAARPAGDPALEASR